MCLIIKHDKKFPGKKGWKFLYKDSLGRLHTGFNGAKITYLSSDKFVKANAKRLHGGGAWHPETFRYTGGFHIFTSKRDASSALRRIIDRYPSLRLCRVEFRRQVVYGQTNWEDHLNTVVARECKLLEILPDA